MEPAEDIQKSELPSVHRKRTRHVSEAGSSKKFSGSTTSRLQQDSQLISSTQLANSVMKFRLGGSIFDPLNLEGDSETLKDGQCSTLLAAPSGRPSLPQHLKRDPLNLEGKFKEFLASEPNFGGASALHTFSKVSRRKLRSRRRSSSTSHEQAFSKKKSSSQTKDSQYCYGNYDRYYGYRNSGIHEKDLRMSLLCKEWFQGRECLDIGSNTGQITINIGRDFKPRKIVGIDIDYKLVGMAWKNLQRECLPAMAPDGRHFPQSLTMFRGPPIFPLLSIKDDQIMEGTNPDNGPERTRIHAAGEFPQNVEFRQCNYVPSEDSIVDDQKPEYDTILALSVTKWIHLNWGDGGIKRFFKRIYNHLRPGGILIIEPQPYTSYSKKKNLTSEIFKNYKSISFFPRDFHSYLMSADVGFIEHKLLGMPDNPSKGFQRPIHMYIKSGPSVEASGSDSARGTIDSSIGNKLKSIVGGVSEAFTLDSTCGNISQASNTSEIVLEADVHT